MLLLTGFLFMVFIFAALGILVGSGLAYMDLPSVLLILMALFFFFFTSKSGSIIGRYFRTSFRKEHTYTRAELASLAAALKNTTRFTLAVGGFGFVFGMLGSLINLENRQMLGPNIAVSLLTLLYAIAIGVFIFFPVQAWAENRINTMKDEIN